MIRKVYPIRYFGSSSRFLTISSIAEQVRMQDIFMQHFVFKDCTLIWYALIGHRIFDEESLLSRNAALSNSWNTSNSGSTRQSDFHINQSTDNFIIKSINRLSDTLTPTGACTRFELRLANLSLTAGESTDLGRQEQVTWIQTEPKPQTGHTKQAAANQHNVKPRSHAWKNLN